MAAQSTSSAVLVFENTEFDVVDIHNAPWLRGYQIGKALEYTDPSQAVAKLYDRNADEFTDDMTQVVDLQTAGGIQPVRIFSPRGCYLLGMLARTEKAKAFRAWVLDVLEGRVVPVQQKPFRGTQIIAAHRHINALTKALKLETNPTIRGMLHAQLSQSCRMTGIDCPALADIGHEQAPQHEDPRVEFWDVLDLLIDGDDKQQLNHARSAELIAINLPQVQAAAQSARLVLPDASDLRLVLKHSRSPKFAGIKAVNSRYAGSTVKCWVFERSDEAGEEI